MVTFRSPEILVLGALDQVMALGFIEQGRRLAHAALGVLADQVGYSSVFLIGGLAASLGLWMVLSARTTSLPQDRRMTVR
jgi:hypothetical protein